ncbi:MAG: aspartate carbamoyltransferase [Dehalococcoidales bacterium]|nr:aspartate carbamoyltransferase [Dehalococcoidales bacterium]
MGLANRNLITIDDLSNQEIGAVFTLANEMSDSMSEQLGVCRGKIMASLFFEPSTRTRLSFETAMLRLGGSIVSVTDAQLTSLAKGESITDMARVVGSYADIIVIRHPWEGAARVVADYAGVPVINAGDGGHEHPTQTLCDLYTLKREKQTISGLKIALWGDLKHGRTIHSLAYALARFGATILFHPGTGLEIPDYVISKLTTEYGGELEPAGTGRFLPLDAIYMTPDKPHQLAMIPEASLRVELKEGIDAVYVTRLQRERLSTTKESEPSSYPVVDKKLLKGKEFKKSLIMHPLPRFNELDHEIDADQRSMYFQQAAWGVPVRMALTALLLGAREIPLPAEADYTAPHRDYPTYQRDFGVRCLNPQCVSVQESEARYIKPGFKIVNYRPLTLRCIYCEHEIHPRFIASSEWHEGCIASKKYHRADSHWTRKIRPENLIIFNSSDDAEAHGFKPSYYATKHHPKGNKEEL